MNRRSFLQVTAAGAAAQTPPPKRAAIRSSVMLGTLPGTFEETVRIAARAGIQSVELYREHLAWTSSSDRAAKLRFLRSYDMTIDSIVGLHDWNKNPVTMVDPAHRDNFVNEVKKAAEIARALEAPNVIVVAGDNIAGRTPAEQTASIIESGKRAAEIAAAHDVTVIIEPLNNKVEAKGHFLSTAEAGLAIVKAVNHPNFRLLYDLYHEQVQTGDAGAVIAAAAPFTPVFHVADAPGRRDPGTGGMNFPALYKAIAATGFKGVIAMEYRPVADPVESLKKAVDQMRAGLAAKS